MHFVPRGMVGWLDWTCGGGCAHGSRQRVDEGNFADTHRLLGDASAVTIRRFSTNLELFCACGSHTKRMHR